MRLERLDRYGPPARRAIDFFLFSQLFYEDASSLEDFQFLHDERLQATRQLDAGRSHGSDVTFDVLFRYGLKGDVLPLAVRRPRNPRCQFRFVLLATGPRFR